MKKLWMLLLPILIHAQVPTGLMVELLNQPELSTIHTATPHFSWIVESNLKNDVQTAFQIKVFDEYDNLLWDSNQISSNQSVGVAYEGPALNQHSHYAWQVRTWNSEKKTSPFSPKQIFHTAEFNTTTAKLPLRQESIPPTAIVQTTDGYFVDFGKAAFGTIQLNTTALQKPATVTFHLGEKLNSALKIDRKPPGTIRYRKMQVELQPGITHYLLPIPPNQRNTGERAIHMPKEIGEVMPFRYCEIENLPFALNTDKIRMAAAFYPFDENAANFECSNPALNKVWELCKYSIKATSFCGVYVDGDRERIPYEADAYLNQLSHYCVDREYAIARFTHEYLINNATWPTEWIMHSVLMAWADYVYTGNTVSLENYYDDLKAKTLTDLARSDGLISTLDGKVTPELLEAIHLNDEIRDIVDWPPKEFTRQGRYGERDGFVMQTYNSVVNAFHYSALQKMQKIAEVTNHPLDEKIFGRQAELVFGAFNKVFWDKENQRYTDGNSTDHASLHANMFALAFDLVPDERKAPVVNFVKSRGMACSVYGSQYLLEALYKAGAAQYALEIMTAEHDRSWMNMINVGSTVTLEAWDWKYKNNLDWNHAWGAAPANIIPRYLMGIQPLEPGFASVRIQPQIADLSFAKITYPTIRGSIEMQIEQNEKEYKLSIRLPANMQAELMLPEHTQLTVDGTAVKMNKIISISGTHNIHLKR